MNPRKRPAEAPLKPPHSAKYRRTKMAGHDRGSPTTSEQPGLLLRWKDVCQQFGALATDTIRAVMHSARPNTPRESDSPPPHRTFPASLMSTPSVSQQPLPALSSTNHGTGQHSSPSTTFAPEAYSSNNETPSNHNKTPVNGILPHNSSRKSGVGGSIPRGYLNRKHIFEKAHKENVKAENQKNREEIQKKLYTIKRSSGYTSNFADFQSLLAFQAKLESLDHRDAFSPSSSMIDLHAKERKSSPRRHSYSYTDDIDFLRRALDRAKATLNEPRPPRPFQPTLEQLRVSQRLKDESIEQLLRPKPRPPTPLSFKDDAQVEIILKKQGIVSRYAREQVNDVDLSRLLPGQWLNDEIINFYGALLLGRSDDCKENPRKQKASGMQVLNVHYFSTFFWSKLKEGYEKGRLAKWTKKVDIFSKDVILIPINHSNAHWTSAAINFRKKRIESFDSMGIRRDIVFKTLRSYLDSEHRNKKKRPFDFTGWQDYSIDEPQQENGGDDVIRFTQKDMPALRRRMIWEIGNAKLRDER
ncbi:hypothetical protein C0992_007196 [Termitomyces sp. T32_za158]|nr:hypothetical protein C0992_007196 [Termitomyces sp. T32_za158]